MTLSERIIDYMEINHLSGAEIARQIGVSPTMITNIRQGKKASMYVRLKIAETLGDEYRQYLEYQICACGKQYIPKTSNQHHCSSECSREYTGRPWGSRNLDDSRPHKLKELEKEKLLEHEQKFPKPKATYAEYNERARSQGLSYGQLQGLERLGLR